MIAWRLSLLAAVLALVAGIWGGSAWRSGQNAIAQNKVLAKQQADDRKTINDLKKTAQTLRQHAVDNALAYDQAMQRIGAIATQLENNLEHNRQFATQQLEALGALAERRPDLGQLRLGNDVLQHWRNSNEGGAAKPAAPAAPPRPAGKPARTVPGAAASGQRRSAGAAGQPRPGDRAVPRLQDAQRVVARVRKRMAGHRMAVVLRGGEGGWSVGQDMPA